MNKISYIVMLSVIYPMTVMGYTPTITNDPDLRDHSYSTEQISQFAYKSAKSKNSRAPVFWVKEGGTTNYYKWTAPDLTLYKTTDNEEDVFSTTNHGNGYISYLTVNNYGLNQTNYAYYNSLTPTNNRIESVLPPWGISGDFIGNVANTDQNGGAIYNETYGGSVTAILGNFINNSSPASGGGIYNNGLTMSIIGDFIHNTSGYGGAIYNDWEIYQISSNFVNNISDIGAGGAIYNNGSIPGGIGGGVFYNNIVNANDTQENIYGGAIYNAQSCTINSINNDFIGNVVNTHTLSDGYGRAYGGAIYNQGSINSITGDFFGNIARFKDPTSWTYVIPTYANASAHGVHGGAIYNGQYGSIGSVSGNFIGNIATTNVSGWGTVGGAILNDYGATINSINGDFIDNRSDGWGGAIANGGTINSINGNFYDNHTSFYAPYKSAGYGGAINNSRYIGEIVGDFVGNTSSWCGGAIYNGKTIDSIVGNFINNDARLSGQPFYLTYGGAIYNDYGGTINSINGDFINNHATLQGGAIYNRGRINSLTGNFNGNDLRARYSDGQLLGEGGAIANFGTIKMEGTVNFLTGTDTIFNYGTISTINGTSDSPTILHLQSVNGPGTFSLNEYTNAYLANGQTIEQDVFYISPNSSLTAAPNSLRKIKTFNNDGMVYLTDGYLNLGVVNGSGNVVISGDVINKNFYPNIVNIADNALFATNGYLLSNPADIHNDGILYITGGTLYNNVTGNGQTIIRNNAVLASNDISNVEINGSWNVGTNTVHATNAHINGYVTMVIDDIAKDSDEYIGGKINADSITFGNTAKTLILIHENNLAKGESTGDLTIITSADWTTNPNLMNNNRYGITFDEENHTFKITLNKTFEEFLEENANSQNILTIANAWNSLNIPNNPFIQELQELLEISSQYDLSEYLRILSSTAPNDTEVVSETSRTVNSAINDQVNMRLAAIGRNGGDTPRNISVWGQFLFNHSVQSGSGSFTGNTLGFTLGADKKFNNNLILGLGYTFNNTSAKSEYRDIDATGHTIFTYAEYRFKDKSEDNRKTSNPWHINSMLSYGMTAYDELASYGITSDYDTVTIGLNGSLGYDITETIDLSLGARYLNISQKDYVDSLYQKISVQDNNILTTTAGAKYMSRGTWFIPNAHIDVSYDVISSDRLVLVTTQSSGYQIIGNHTNPFGIQTGVGFDINLYNWKMSLNYDLDWHPEFISHTGRLKIKYTF